jgi:hypothetical protein
LKIESVWRRITHPELNIKYVIGKQVVWRPSPNYLLTVVGWATKLFYTSTIPIATPHVDHSRNLVQHIPIVDIESIVCHDAEILSPSQFMYYYGAGKGKQIGLKPVASGPLPLLKHSAMNGFRGLSVPRLKDLCKMPSIGLKHRGPMPSTEFPLVMLLLKHVFPDAAKEELEKYAKRRWETRKFPYECLLEAQDVEEVAAELEEGHDREDMVQLMHAVIDAKTDKAASKVGARRMNKKTAAKPVVQRPAIEGALDVEQARLLLPQVKGCTAYKDVSFHYRWKMTYPRESPPFQVTQAFGVSSDRGAMLFCLRRVWEWHLEQEGEMCPWMLES